MPRRLIPFVPELYYHIYNRGNNRERIFFETENYLFFLKKIKQYLVPVADVLVYCLMPTHYHVVGRVKPNKTSEVRNSEILKISEFSAISTAMMKLSVSYTKAINKRFQRVGVLFQGQFQAKPILTSSYLLNLCRYIHGNPVKDGLVADIEQWPYSNYLEWIGERNGKLVDKAFVRDNFDTPDQYRKFVLEYLRNRQLPDDIQRYLNSLEG
ncbi:MAG: transposase [Anaerolineales bacterium]|nr:transposase [Anaerolineales bacterium]